MPQKDRELRAKYNSQYRRDHKKRVPFDVNKVYYEDILAPIPDMTGTPINTFIKQAIAEKIIRDDIDLPIGKYL